ncbi:hypothetical protein AMAG_20429 [Allomyces macrogynus ATCC 38327]|uniref:Uncharacterized protein n=1 Tax=Allomyces macrogynus (strain ATCC 38327) TaxID=578462 RepID=A0A0L0TBG6_ALLM3|nr:hypothetical protein AMAG_20429 [Allomyces macrogynus ATCC 38327]|eukprot:KNE72040.1 hypothetical protein AMAG_20429 [Allomyces macrogynus ATCC 38327]
MQMRFGASIMRLWFGSWTRRVEVRVGKSGRRMRCTCAACRAPPRSTRSKSSRSTTRAFPSPTRPTAPSPYGHADNPTATSCTPPPPRSPRPSTWFSGKPSRARSGGPRPSPSTCTCRTSTSPSDSRATPTLPTLAECHAASLDALRDEADTDPHVRAWLARAPHQLAWRRGDRIEWIDVSAPGLELVVAPYSIEKTHALELRAVGPHGAGMEGDATQCEGYLMRHWSSWVGPRARRVYAMVVLHEYLFFLAAPPGRVTPATAGWTASMARRPYAVEDSRARAKGCVVPGAEFLRLEEILAIVVPRPCVECRAKLAALTHITDGEGIKLVQLAAEDAMSAAPPFFHLITRSTVLDLSAETHAALHAWTSWRP